MSTGDSYTILKDVFGYSAFREGQSEIIDDILAGQNILAVMPTGAGKSLCYQIPALMMDGPAIIVSPLISLIENQVFALRSQGVNVSCIHSGQSRDENIHQWRALTSGKSKMLYLSPEKLMTERMMSAMEKLRPSLFVIDEAHCVAKWGPDFREDYARLSQLHKTFPNTPIAAFTATADEATRQNIAEVLFDKKGKISVQGFDRPNLSLAVSSGTNKTTSILDFIGPRKGQSGIVYALSRKNTEEITDTLQKAGFNAEFYHAGMDDYARREVLNRFLTESDLIVVATIAFGMGIDKPDIRFVYHANLPGSMEEYYQEIGRAGRDGKPADTYLYYALRDISLRRKFILDSQAEEGFKIRQLKRLDALMAYCEAPACRRQVLLDYFGDKSEPCGNCDNCLNPPKLIDDTKNATLLLNIIRATGSRFGQTYLIDIARGRSTPRIVQNRHDQLPEFGGAKAMGDPFLKSLIRQAIAAGIIEIDIERMGALRPTPKSQDILSGKTPFMCKDYKTTTRKAVNKKKQTIPKVDLTQDENELFLKLKATRLEIARELGRPAFLIFKDLTLIEMARKTPSTPDALLEISGVGPGKLKAFGDRFLQTINR